MRCWRPARNDSTDGLARSESLQYIEVQSLLEEEEAVRQCNIFFTLFSLQIKSDDNDVHVK